MSNTNSIHTLLQHIADSLCNIIYMGSVCTCIEYFVHGRVYVFLFELFIRERKREKERKREREREKRKESDSDKLLEIYMSNNISTPL